MFKATKFEVSNMHTLENIEESNCSPNSTLTERTVHDMDCGYSVPVFHLVTISQPNISKIHILSKLQFLAIFDCYIYLPKPIHNLFVFCVTVAIISCMSDTTFL